MSIIILDEKSTSRIIKEENEEVLTPSGPEFVKNLPEVDSKIWNDQEHALYILFLELNRQKTKSKLIRRSNSFYKEMSQFILTKTAVQCRSHHQKFQIKYKFPHRIIKEEKDRIDCELYNHLQKEKLTEGNRINKNSENIDSQSSTAVKKTEKIKKGVQFQCQTDLMGVNHHLSMSDVVPCTNFQPLWQNHGSYPIINYQQQWRPSQMCPPWMYPFY